MNSIRRHLPASLLLGLLVTLFLQWKPFSAHVPYRLAVKIESPRDGRATVAYDRGNGINAFDSDTAWVVKGTQWLWFPLPDATIKALRLTPLDHEAAVRLEKAAIFAPDGKVHCSIPPQAWQPTQAGMAYHFGNEGATMQTIPQGALVFIPSEPLRLHRDWLRIHFWTACLQWIAASGLAFAAFHFGARQPWAKWKHLGAALEVSPQRMVALTSLVATMLSCHPVIFAGRSFVSPANGAVLLYPTFPTIPGATDEVPEDGRGSDTGATMWAHLTYSVVQHRSIFLDGELPLWNRYTHCGSPLLGQGQSMLGDPLHWLPIIAKGSPLAWDIKFLLARFLFSAGIGLCALAATQRLKPALVMTFSSAFIGFFAYRLNHCATFSFCYAPWILLPWLRVAKTQHRLWPWAVVIAGANFWQINSGTAKESAMLIVGLNFTGALLVLVTAQPACERLRRLGVMLWGCGLFILLSAPHWMIFLDALRGAWTSYAEPKVFTIQRALLIGLFDDLFYRQANAGELHTNPSANFLVLLGVAWAATHAAKMPERRTAATLAVGALPHAAIVFGLVPASLLKALPFVANIQHIDNTFSCVLLIHLLVLAAHGLATMSDALRQPSWRRSVLLGGLPILALSLLFLLAKPVAHRMAEIATVSAQKLILSGFFIAYASVLTVAVIALPYCLHRWRRLRSLTALIVAAIAFFTMHFRHMQWCDVPFRDYVVNPGFRDALADTSGSLGALSTLAQEKNEPFRIAGLHSILVPGYNTILALEHFTGADAIVPRHQRELIEAAKLPNVWVWRWIIPRDMPTRVRLLTDAMNVRYFLNAPDALPREPEGLKRSTSGDVDILASATVWPRAYFTNDIRTGSTALDFLQALESSPGKPFAMLSTRPAKVFSAPDQFAKATDYRLTANCTAFRVEAPGPGFVVLSESYDQGNWLVLLNGVSVDPVRVNHAFLGVPVPAGSHHLEFRYWPRVLSSALWVALAGLLLLSLTPVVACVWRRHRKP